MAVQRTQGLYSNMAFVACAAIAVAMLPLAAAHEHDEDKIPEGETISLEPIVHCLFHHPVGLLGH